LGPDQTAPMLLATFAVAPFCFMLGTPKSWPASFTILKATVTTKVHVFRTCNSYVCVSLLLGRVVQR